MGVDEFRKLIECLPDATLVVSAAGVILGANGGVARLGLDPTVLPGKRLSDIAAQPPEELSDFVRRSLSSGELSRGLVKLRGDDGKTLLCRAGGSLLGPRGELPQSEAAILLRLAPKRVSAGRLSRLTRRIRKLGREIRRRKRLEEEIREQKERLAVTLASIGDAVIATEIDGRVVLMNVVAESLCEWPLSEAVGRPLPEVFQIINEFTRAPVENPVEKVIREGRTVGLANHSLLVSRNGKVTPIDHSAAPIVNNRGEVSGVVLVFRDVEVRMKAQELKERLAAIVESSDDIIVSETLDGIITSWNQGAERTLAYTAEEAIGQHVSMLMPLEAKEDTEKVLGRIRRGEKVDHYQTKRQRKDGTIVDVSITVSPIRNADGEIIGASKVGRDITGIQKTAELRERLAAIIESSDDIIVSKNLDGIIESWNKGAERILGYRADEMIGKHVSLMFPPECKEDTEKILGRIRRGEKVDHYETKRLRKDGTVIDVSLTVSPIRDASGKIIGASKIGRDITQQKRIEAERIEADRRKDEFLAMLAHELRNPLASISSALQLFGRLETERELEWAKDVIQRHVRHLARLIDDLLDISRITRGKIRLRKEPVNLSPIVSSAVEVVRPLIEERKHELGVSLTRTLRLEADPLRLEQILVNLLTNAAKYTEAGGHIGLSARPEGPEIVIKIRDTGVGIGPELLPRVFDLFVQGDRTIARSEGGLGIGLSLVKSLVEMHGGRVTARSEGVGKGSEFEVRLPALGVANPRTTNPATIPQPASGQSFRVLVVDDNADTAWGVSKLLTLLGHEVRTAHDGLTAISLARSYRPEVVLLDIGLPGRDGYAVVKQLRQENCCDGAIIVAVSGYGQEEDRRRSREAGFDRHLVKPVDYEALLSIFERAPYGPAAV
jgi:PAS domain S-box-containing protein